MKNVIRASERLVTLSAAEVRTGRKVSTWRKDIRLRKVPYVKLGRSVRIPEEFINQMIANGWHEPVEVAR